MWTENTVYKKKCVCMDMLYLKMEEGKKEKKEVNY